MQGKCLPVIFPQEWFYEICTVIVTHMGFDLNSVILSSTSGFNVALQMLFFSAKLLLEGLNTSLQVICTL